MEIEHITASSAAILPEWWIVREHEEAIGHVVPLGAGGFVAVLHQTANNGVVVGDAPSLAEAAALVGRFVGTTHEQRVAAGAAEHRPWVPMDVPT